MSITLDQASYAPGDLMTITIAAHSETPNGCTINGVAATIEAGADNTSAEVYVPGKSAFAYGGAHQRTRWEDSVFVTMTFPTESVESDSMEISPDDGTFYQAATGETEPGTSHAFGTDVGDDVYWEVTSGAGTVNDDGVWQITSVPCTVERRWFDVSVDLWSAVDTINFYAATTTTQNALQAALSAWTSETFLECLTITHPDLAAPVYLVNDQADLTRTAGTFVAFPFRARLHTRAEDAAVEAEVTADNVDQRLIEALRGLGDGAALTYEVVLLDTPNEVEMGPLRYEITGYVADMRTISLRLGFELDFLAESWPKDYFSPGNSAG